MFVKWLNGLWAAWHKGPCLVYLNLNPPPHLAQGVQQSVSLFVCFVAGVLINPAYNIFWPPDVKNWLIGKDPDARKDRRQEKGTTEDEMVGWHHRLQGHEFDQASGVGDGQGTLASCSPWGFKESKTIEQLNWTESLLLLFLSVTLFENIF